MEFRKSKQVCRCRGCDKSIEIGSDIFYTRSWRNGGMNIIFCRMCTVKIDEIAKEYYAKTKLN